VVDGHARQPVAGAEVGRLPQHGWKSSGWSTAHGALHQINQRSRGAEYDCPMKAVQLLLVPYDSGRRDWRMGAGPGRLVAAGLAARLEARGCAVESSAVVPESEAPAAEIATAFELMRLVAVRVRAAREAGRFPLVLSGNCNTAPGTLAGLSPLSRAVFWFDAHADVNTPETTGSGFLDGMALATALGWCWQRMTDAVPGFEPVPEGAAVLMGARDLDPPEAERLSRSAVRLLSPESLRTTRLDQELRSFRSTVEAAYVHCDLDVLDPSLGQANPFPAPAGLSVAEVERVISAIGRTIPVRAAALAAYAPEYDPDGRVAEAAIRIAESILAVAAS
jgi:arginase